MPAQPPESASLDDAVPLRDYWRVLVRHRTFLCGLVVLTALATALFTLLQPNIYQSTATLMPLGASRSGLAGALGELGGFLPPGLAGKESPTDRLLAVLQSRTLATDVIEPLDLLHVLFVTQWDAETHQWRTMPHPTLQDAVRALGGLVSVTASRQGLMTIAVTHHEAG